jgi:HAD superfamily hydrolase (TIGR01509 family)
VLGLPDGVTTCLFDLDGVLTEVHAKSWKEMFDNFLRGWYARKGEPFREFMLPDDYDTYVDGKPRRDGVQSFLESRGIDLPEPYEGSVRYVETARDAGLHRAVVSSSTNCKDVLAAAGIEDLFEVRIDGIVAEREHLKGKPAPDTFLAGAKALGAKPAEVVVQDLSELLEEES